MKLRVERDTLAEAVTWTARSVPTRPPVPVLSGIRLEAEPAGGLSLATFDYEISARSRVAAEVESPGTALVSGRLLAEICRSLPNRPVDITLEGTKVVLECGSTRFQLATMPVEDYPGLPALPAAAGSIASGDFAQSITQVIAAAGKDETLPLLTAVRLEFRGSNLTLLATDRYRLALREVPWSPLDPEFTTDVLVRARSLADVARSLTSGGSIEISLTPDSDLIGYEAGGRRTTSLLVTGEYPPLRRLFPEETNTYAVVSTAALVEATKRVALVADQHASIRLSFTAGQVELEAGQGDDAQAAEGLEAALVGEDISTAFNPQYLLDGLNALDHPYVRLKFTHPSKPAELNGQAELEGEADSSFRYLLMPIRLAG